MGRVKKGFIVAVALMLSMLHMQAMGAYARSIVFEEESGGVFRMEEDVQNP